MPDDFAYRFLEHLQADGHDRLGRPSPVIDPDLNHRMVITVLEQSLRRPPTPAEIEKELVRFYSRALQPTSTRFEEPSANNLLKGLIQHVDKVLLDAGVGLPDRPAFGTFLTGQVNAMTVAVPGGGHLVLLEQEMFTFANLICKAVVLALPPSPGLEKGFSIGAEAVSAHLDADDTAVVRFTEALLAYVVDGRTTSAPRYLLDTWNQQVINSLFRDSLEFFVVGHEYGHLVAGHLGPAVRLRATALPTGTPVEEVDYAWEQEYEADFVGAQLGSLAMADKITVDHDWLYCGFEIFFGALDVMDRAVSLLQFGVESARRSGSHPPSFQRRQMLRDRLTRMLSESDDEGADPIDVERILGFGRILADVLDILWERTRPAVVRAREQGVRPAPMWTSALKEAV